MVDLEELGEVPVADGFRVEVLDHKIELTSGNRRLAWFPAWEHADRDLRHFVPADVPLGTLDAPFVDEDEGWRIEIFEHDGFIYVVENGRPFRVPREQYVAAWARVINEYNPILDLDDLMGEDA